MIVFVIRQLDGTWVVVIMLVIYAHIRSFKGCNHLPMHLRVLTKPQCPIPISHMKGYPILIEDMQSRVLT